MTTPEDDFTTLVNQHLGGFNENLGLTFVRAGPDEAVAVLELRPRHLQPYGLVHGGVYAAMIETVCSTAAAINTMPQGRHAVGLENSTSFLRAVRDGKLTCRAVPMIKGHRTHVWSAEVLDEEGRLLATGRVRMLCLDQGQAVAGESVALKTEGPSD